MSSDIWYRSGAAVAVGPGLKTLTLMFRGASSTAKVRASAFEAAFAAIATDGPTTGVDANALPVMITEAPSARWGRAA